MRTKELVYEIDGSFYFKDSSGAVVQCEESGVAVKPIEYTDAYFDKWRHIEQSRIDAINKIRFSLLSTLCGDFESVLDYGCGTGDFVLWLRLNLPSSVYSFGWDLCDFDSNKARELTVFGENPLDMCNPIDVVTAFDSLEHLQNPKDLFILDPNFFVVSVPNADLRLWSDKSMFLNWRHYRPNEHIWYFDKYSLTNFFQENGYRRLFVGYPEDAVRTYGGCLFSNILTGVFVKE